MLLSGEDDGDGSSVGREQFKFSFFYTGADFKLCLESLPMMDRLIVGSEDTKCYKIFSEIFVTAHQKKSTSSSS